MIPAEFTGGWFRDGIGYDGAELAEDETVWWLQAPSRHADLRTPLGGGATATCFAGVTSWDGRSLTWQHELDLTPDPGGSIDTGVVAQDGDALFEYGSFEQDGRTVAYAERWRRLPGSAGPLWALRSATGRIVRAGSYALTIVDERRVGGEFFATAWLLEGGEWTRHRSWPPGADGRPPPIALTELEPEWVVDESA